MPIKYIGRTTNFKGKSLWEILGNLKDFGVGRIVVRSVFERYPQPTFNKIMKVEALPHEENRKITVWVERTFRGQKSPGLVKMCSTSYKKDYRLLMKHEEAEYCKCDDPLVPEKILPRSSEFPPLLKELLIQEKIAKGEDPTVELRLPLKYGQGPNRNWRVAEEGETPTIKFCINLGTPASPNLYKGIKL